MYDFEIKVKVKALFEVTYQTTINDFDQREGSYTRKVTKSERFNDWNDVYVFGHKKDIEIIQVVEVHDLTHKLKYELDVQGKD